MVANNSGVLDLNTLNNQIASLFDNGLQIYTSFAERIAASRLILRESEAKIDALDNPLPIPQETPKIFGIDRNIVIIGGVGVAVIAVILIMRKR